MLDGVSSVISIRSFSHNFCPFLDTRPGQDDSSFGGAWSVYPFFSSGNVIVTDTQEGLFVVQLEAVQAIFTDGFESGDTASWSQTTPP